MKDLASLLGAIGALLWPLIAIVLMIVFVPTLRTVLRTRAFTVKVGSFELSAQEATDTLTRQIDDLQKQVSELLAGRAAGPPPPPSAPPRADPSRQARYPGPSATGPPKRVLWVDDKPSNNAFEISRMRDVGMEVVTAQSTDEALDALRADPSFDAVISDMGRREGLRYAPMAGLDTARRAREMGFGGTVVIYTSPKVAKEYVEQAREATAGITASPTDLYRLLGMT